MTLCASCIHSSKNIVIVEEAVYPLSSGPLLVLLKILWLWGLLWKHAHGMPHWLIIGTRVGRRISEFVYVMQGVGLAILETKALWIQPAQWTDKITCNYIFRLYYNCILLTYKRIYKVTNLFGQSPNDCILYYLDWKLKITICNLW